MKTAHAQKIFHAEVRQDKIGIAADRQASVQPAVVKHPRRSVRVSRNTPRSQTVPEAPTKAVPVQFWVKPIVKAEIARIADIDGLSLSATGAALLEEIIRQKLHVQQAATLETAIEKSMAKANRSMATRMAWLLIRIAFDVGHIKVLATNTLEAVLKPQLSRKINLENRCSTRQTPVYFQTLNRSQR